MTTTVTEDDMSELRVLTEDQVSELTGLGRNTLKAMRRRGEGPTVTVLSAGRIGYQVRHVRSWLDSRAERPELTVADQTDAASAILDAVELRLAEDGTGMVQGLRGTPQQVYLRALEAVELLAFLARQSDRPAELIAALRERVTAAKGAAR
ncbi:hypothetical protein BH10ACT9_BH10ACT9_18090 [soil metagenome]